MWKGKILKLDKSGTRGQPLKARGGCPLVLDDLFNFKFSPLLFPTIFGVIRIRSAEKESLTILEGDVRPICPIFTILSAIPFNRDLSSRQQRFLSEAAPQQNIRTAAFDHPGDDFAVGAG